MTTAKGIVTKVKEAVTEFFSPEEVSKSPTRVAAGKKAALTRKRKAAGKKAATTKARKAAGKKAAATRASNAVAGAAKKAGAVTKKVAKKAPAKKATAAKRELIAPKGDKRYIRRDEKGRIKESDDVGRSLAQDVRKAAKTVAKPGQGDKGDHKKAAKKAPVKKAK
jgi:hypothetical protein